MAQKLWWFMRPLTWKEQAICLQTLQAVVITFLLFNFLEEYIIVERTLTTLISLRCTGNVRALVRFFSRCIHKMFSCKEVPEYMRSGTSLWTQKRNIFV